ncbi:ABC transporter substrate-binding protein [Nocardioides phosphati]|uniref:ABC transporter substrate-binding protein n=1 Tax=Nocardioides phosphati TaxID=1867775 RepID=A0ABQ2NDK5_9ACTN|nr:MCE family protein [Nocardioides phosphati]GGO93921.1 ABC transporter substrate-binding protein [Nocardioides phosphati]
MLSRRRLLVGVVLAVLVGALVVGFRGARDDRWTVAAEFTDTTGLYVGNEVQYLGVPVGKITAIEPEGRVVRVEMVVDGDIEVPRKAVAEVLQSALLTDRYVALGPAYTGGPRLHSGATITAADTRSPISFDDLGKSIDQLVVALDRQGPGGRDIGDLLHVTAANLDGNGKRIQRLITSSTAALASIDRKEPDLIAVAHNLRVLAHALAKRDAMVRRFTTNMSESSRVVAGQTESLDRTLSALSDLTTEVSSFIGKNRKVLTHDLGDVAAVTRTIRQQQGALARVFDYLPTGAENIVRAYDPSARSLRVQLAIRDMAVFNPLVRQGVCSALVGDNICSLLVKPDGSGVADLLFDLVEGTIPGEN